MECSIQISLPSESSLISFLPSSSSDFSPVWPGPGYHQQLVCTGDGQGDGDGERSVSASGGIAHLQVELYFGAPAYFFNKTTVAYTKTATGRIVSDSGRGRRDRRLPVLPSRRIPGEQ